MTPILDKIQSQLITRRTLSQHKYYSALLRDRQPPFIHEIYPFGFDYYHELNPFFLINILRPNFIDFSKTITVRDGKITFAAFMTQTFQFFKTWKAHFFIDPSLAFLIPPQYADRFLGWQIQQVKEFNLKKCRHLLIAGIANLSCISSLEKLEAKLKNLSQLPLDTKIEILLPARKDPLNANWKEDYLMYEIILMLKKYAQERPLLFVRVQDVLERTTFKDIQLLELFADNKVISDSYLSHYVVARGGVSNSFTTKTEIKPIFELDLSFYHKIQIIELPKVESFFNELIFYKKLNPKENFYQDEGFKELIEKQDFQFLPKA